jgi:hypothetical protein
MPEQALSNQIVKKIYVKSKNVNHPKIKQKHNKLLGSQKYNILSNNPQPQLPISSSSHPLEISITPYHQRKIIETFNCHTSQLLNSISDLNGSTILSIDHLSFRQLLQHGFPINDTIIHVFLSLLHKNNENIFTLDTNFPRVLCSQGWDAAFNTFFLHEHSSKHAKKNKKQTHNHLTYHHHPVTC